MANVFHCSFSSDSSYPNPPYFTLNQFTLFAAFRSISLHSTSRTWLQSNSKMLLTSLQIYHALTWSLSSMNLQKINTKNQNSPPSLSTVRLPFIPPSCCFATNTPSPFRNPKILPRNHPRTRQDPLHHPGLLRSSSNHRPNRASAALRKHRHPRTW